MPLQNIESNKIEGFDFTGSMTLLVSDITGIHPFFRHIRIENILIAVSRSNGNRNGVLARLRPMLFEGGSMEKTIHGTRYTAPEVRINGSKILYVIYFHLPRFLNYGDQKSKLATIIHELHHISPLFNGDVRRYPGKNYAHGNSRKNFDDLIQIYTDEYINSTPHPEFSCFLKNKYYELRRKYGSVRGDMIRISRPKQYQSRKYSADI